MGRSRDVLTLAVAACLSGGIAGPALAGTVPYARLVMAQITFERIAADQRDKLRVRVAVSHADAADHSPIHLWVEDGGQRVALKLLDDGVLDLELRQDWVDRNVIVRTDQPDKSLTAAVDIAIVVPDGGAIADDYLRDAAAQTQTVIGAGARQLAGMFAFFVTPKVRGVKITLAKCCGETARLSAGEKQLVLAQDKSGQVSVPRDALERFGGGAFAASAGVTGIDPWVE